MEALINFLISPALADAVSTAPVPPASNYSFIMMFVVFFLFIYFGIWRPQSKRAKEQQNLVNSLAKGDEVMTSGGIIGRINKVSDQYISLMIANNTEIILQKTAIVSLLPKGTLKSIEQS